MNKFLARPSQMGNGKRKRRKLTSKIRSKISIPEINKINEDRLSRDVSCRWRKKRKVCNTSMMVNNDDLISRLPDDILCSIISRLSVREAVGTSILSRGWKLLWRRSLKKLDFDAMNMSGDITKYKKQFDKDAFVRCVNQITKLHCGEKIESFRVDRRLLPQKHYSHIDKWIQFAANKKVEKLDIILFQYDKPYNFSHLVFPEEEKEQSLKHLSLGNCKLNLPSKFTNFSSLISLTLKNAHLTQVELTNILSNCLSLEWLSISTCDYCPKRLKFTSLKLKHLSINNLYPMEVDIIDLENLMSFEFSGDMLNEFVCNKNAAVTRVCFHRCYPRGSDVDYAIHGHLATDFPQLETLLLTSFPAKENHRVIANLPLFTRLNHLVLILDNLNFEDNTQNLLEPTASFLKASPFLQKLELRLPRGQVRKRERTIISNQSYQHYNLKEVKMYNFYGHTTQLELLEYLLNHVSTLEKIQIYRKYVYYQGDGLWTRLQPLRKEISKNKIFRMLHKRIPTQITLKIM